MSPMEKADKIKRLDEVAFQWKTLPLEGYEAQRESLWFELFELFLDLFKLLIKILKFLYFI